MKGMLKKAIKTSAISLSLMGLLLGSGAISNANAQAQSCLAEISRPGLDPTIKATPTVDGDDYSVWLKCDWWAEKRHMFFHPELGEAGLAVALTAVTTTGYAYITVENGNWYSLITDIRLAPAPAP